MTGISTMSDFEGLLMLLMKIKPDIRRIGTIFTPGETNSVAYRSRLEEAAKKAGLQLVSMPANTASEVLEAAKTLVANKIDAFTQISDNLIGSCSAAILKVSFNSRVPYFGFVSHHLGQGAVAVCARDNFQAGFEAGVMGLSVIAGQDPAKVPIRFVNKTDFIVCEENARHFNITIPDRLFREIPTMKRFTRNDQTK
jgi:putative ABC transport system substrate-binding protein